MGWPNQPLQSVGLGKELVGLKVAMSNQQSGWLAPWRVLTLWLSVAGLIFPYLQQRAVFLPLFHLLKPTQCHNSCI